MPSYRKLALYSDQEIPANGEMDARALRLIGRSQPRIGYVPADSDPERLGFLRKVDYYAAIGANLALFLDPNPKTSADEWATLFSCDAIHLSGGNTFGFLSRLRQAGGLTLLTRYVAAGGVLIGVSAGAIMMTPSVESASLCGDARDEPSMDPAGLGLVDFHFWPHFDAQNMTPEQLQLSSTIPFLYACPDGSGIIVDGAEVELVGQVQRYHPTAVRPASFED